MQFHDLPLDERLLAVRHGTAYFTEKLAELTDDELNHATLLPGWTRRHLLAHVGNNARALRRLLDWASTGIEIPMYTTPQQRDSEIAEDAKLNPDALRRLVAKSSAQLDASWRSLPPSAWPALVRTAQGRTVPASETIWMRSREVWIHAVDLDNGAQFSEFPSPVLDSLLSDIASAWRTRHPDANLALAADGRAPITVGDRSPSAAVVSGTLPAVVRWAAGRGSIGVQPPDDHMGPPRWL